MTSEDVEAAIRRELMEQGVVAPEPARLKELSEVEVQSAPFYVVSMKPQDATYCDEDFDAVFETIEEAQAFVDLKPRKTDYNYSIGSKYPYTKKAVGYTIRPVSFYARSDVLGRVRDILVRNKEIEKSNTEEAERYEREMKAVGEISKPIWADYYDCKNKSADLLRIVRVYKQYLEDAENNAFIAMNFLGRAFTTDQIDEAREWHGSIPYSTNP